MRLLRWLSAIAGLAAMIYLVRHPDAWRIIATLMIAAIIMVGPLIWRDRERAKNAAENR